jgi:hypothetical protein
MLDTLFNSPVPSSVALSIRERLYGILYFKLLIANVSIFHQGIFFFNWVLFFLQFYFCIARQQFSFINFYLHTNIWCSSAAEIYKLFSLSCNMGRKICLQWFAVRFFIRFSEFEKHILIRRESIRGGVKME